MYKQVSTYLLRKKMFSKKLLITACDKDCKHFIDVVRGIEHVGAGWAEHAESCSEGHEKFTRWANHGACTPASLCYINWLQLLNWKMSYRAMLLVDDYGFGSDVRQERWVLKCFLRWCTFSKKSQTCLNYFTITQDK